LKPTEKGKELISLIKNKLPLAGLLISPEMTGQLEHDLAKVEKGEFTLADYMSEVEEAITRILNELRSYEKKHGKTPLSLAPSQSAKKTDTGKTAKKRVAKEHSNDNKVKSKSEETTSGQLLSNGKTYDKLGVCPRCGGDIIEGQKGYGCSNWKEGCSFVVWKKEICGKKLTPTQMKSLLKKGKTPLIKGFKSKSGKSFAASLVWDNAETGKLKFEFQSE